MSAGLSPETIPASRSRMQGSCAASAMMIRSATPGWGAELEASVGVGRGGHTRTLDAAIGGPYRHGHVRASERISRAALPHAADRHHRVRRRGRRRRRLGRRLGRGRGRRHRYHARNEVQRVGEPDGRWFVVDFGGRKGGRLDGGHRRLVESVAYRFGDLGLGDLPLGIEIDGDVDVRGDAGCQRLGRIDRLDRLHHLRRLRQLRRGRGLGLRKRLDRVVLRGGGRDGRQPAAEHEGRGRGRGTQWSRSARRRAGKHEREDSTKLTSTMKGTSITGPFPAGRAAVEVTLCLMSQWPPHCRPYATISTSCPRPCPNSRGFSFAIPFITRMSHW